MRYFVELILRAVLPSVVLAALAVGDLRPSAGNVAEAQGQEHHAGLVLQFSDGSVKRYCIPFTGDSISGLDLLLKTGLEVKLEAYGGMGGEICKIGSDGCDYPGQVCACQSYGVGGVYWSYHHLKDGQWKTSVTGAGTYKLHDGDVDGWAWSDGKPPTVSASFAELCTAEVPANTVPSAVPAANTNTPRPPGATSIPQKTRTLPVLTSTATPTPRPRPGNTPTATPEVSFTTAAVAAPPTTTQTEQATATGTPTATQTSVETPTSTTVPSPSVTVQAGRTLTPSPTVATTLVGKSTNNPEDKARIFGVVLGMAAALGFIAWRGITASSRGRGR